MYPFFVEMLFISKRIRDTILTDKKRSPTFAAEIKKYNSNDSSRTIQEDMAGIHNPASCRESVTFKVLQRTESGLSRTSRLDA